MSFQVLYESYISSRLLYAGNVIVLRTVDSTNKYLIDNFLSLQLGSVCLAETQTHGRGRYGKDWISPYNNNLYLSFYWFFMDYSKRQSIFVLSLVISVVIGELLQKLGVQGITLKWPNDIYVSGNKLAGILIDVVGKFYDCLHVIIGVGINITTMLQYFKSGEQVISLEEIGIFINRNVLAVHVINVLYRSLIQFERFGFLPFYFRWLSLDSCYNQSVKLIVENQIIFGVSRGVNNNGSLLLDCAGCICFYSCVKNISLRRCC